MSTTFTLTTTVNQPFDQAVESTRAALADEGFGIISTIDMAATLKEKLDVDIPPQLILGACRPQLAHQAVEADPSVATLLPCNVVVRQTDTNTCVVEAFDPEAMTRISDNEAVKSVADDARTRLIAALSTLTRETQEQN